MSTISSTRLGDLCLIDSKDTYAEYNADLIRHSIMPGDITPNYHYNTHASTLLLFDSYSDCKTLTLEFYVCGMSRADLRINLSRLTLACQSCTVNISMDAMQYRAILTGSTTEDYAEVFDDGQYYSYVAMTFAAIEQMPLTTIEMDNSGFLYNPGNTTSGGIITITPNDDIESVKVTINQSSFTLFNLSSNAPVVLDGLQMRMLENGQNKFLDTDMVTFPIIEPGKNTVSFPASVRVTVAFYPTFV